MNFSVSPCRRGLIYFLSRDGPGALVIVLEEGVGFFFGFEGLLQGFVFRGRGGWEGGAEEEFGFELLDGFVGAVEGPVVFGGDRAEREAVEEVEGGEGAVGGGELVAVGEEGGEGGFGDGTGDALDVALDLADRDAAEGGEVGQGDVVEEVLGDQDAVGVGKVGGDVEDVAVEGGVGAAGKFAGAAVGDGFHGPLLGDGNYEF
jgi:hypothetical protein